MCVYYRIKRQYNEFVYMKYIMHISMKSETDMIKVPLSFQVTLFKLDI